MNNKDLMLLGTNDFKRRLFDFPDLSDEERGEINCTEVTYSHLCFGVLPDKMTFYLLAKLVRSKEFNIRETDAFPLYPIVQSSWDGGRLADRLISAKIVQESKRAVITERLTGRHFLEGCVLGVLDEKDVQKVSQKLSLKAGNVSGLIGDSDELKSTFCSLFELNPEDLPVGDDLGELFEKRFKFPIRELHSVDSLGSETLGEWAILAKMGKKQRMMLSPDEFKKGLVDSPYLSDEERNEINSTALTYLHLYFGVVPDKMTIPLLAKIARFKEFQIEEGCVFPLYPLVQSSWDGVQLADWLITANIVQESRRADIAERLTGRHFLKGCVKDILNHNDFELIYQNLAGKLAVTFANAPKLFRKSDKLKSAFCALFNMDQNNLPIDGYFKGILTNMCTIERLSLSHCENKMPGLDVAYNQLKDLPFKSDLGRVLPRMGLNSVLEEWAYRGYF
jgi:hypothetical protein